MVGLQSFRDIRLLIDYVRPSRRHGLVPSFIITNNLNLKMESHRRLAPVMFANCFSEEIFGGVAFSRACLNIVAMRFLEPVQRRRIGFLYFSLKRVQVQYKFFYVFCL